jgi:hypothetical protein
MFFAGPYGFLTAGCAVSTQGSGEQLLIVDLKFVERETLMALDTCMYRRIFARSLLFQGQEKDLESGL